MKAKHLSRPALLALASCSAALMVSSCAYDPFAYNATGSATASFPVSYGSSDGYYDDYNNYDVAVPATIALTLVATGSQYWGYDPYRHSYYDYRQSCYYDPWLNCYYPHDYRPRPVCGVPHPYGWHPGHGVCPYPRHPHHRWVNNHYDRLQGMKASHYAWAQNVRYNRQSWADHMHQYPHAWQHRLQPRNHRGQGQHANRPPNPARPMAGHRGNANPGHSGQGVHGNSHAVPGRPPQRAQRPYSGGTRRAGSVPTPNRQGRARNGTRPPAPQNTPRKKFGGWFNTPVSAPAPGLRPSAAATRPHNSDRSARQRLKAANQQAIARQKTRRDALRQRIQSARQTPHATRSRTPARRSIQTPARPARQAARPKIGRPHTPARGANLRAASRAARQNTIAAAQATKTRRWKRNR